MKLRVFSFLFAASVLILADACPAESQGLFGSPATPERASIVKFSHKFHIDSAAVTECTICHSDVDTSMVASDNLLPTMASCASCHDVEDAEQCVKCHYGEEYPPFVNPEREVKFSHQGHVGAQKLDCTTCHKGLEEADYATDANLPSMETCVTCHDGAKVTNNCESCHLNFATLLPPDHRASGFVRNHKEITRLGGLDAGCQTCHSERYCQDCHLDGGVKSFGPRDRSSDLRPNNRRTDSPKNMTLQSVHELNYRFTHSMDARSKSLDCTSCHSEQTFCATCHEAGGNVTQQNFRPASHSVPGFTTLGKGSGGGLHAEEARRDLESCISCHDVEGRDPTCMTCHTENGQVR